MEKKITVNGFWHGDVFLNEMQLLSIKSLLCNGFNYKLWSFDRILNLPDECERGDASEFLSRNLLFRPLAIFADWFRVELLFNKGGLWSDLDVICLKPFTPPFPWYCIRNGVAMVTMMNMEKGSLIMKNFVDYYRANTRREEIEWTFASSNLSRIIRENQSLPREDNYNLLEAVHYNEFKSLFDGTLRLNDEKFKDSWCIHLFNQMGIWSRSGFKEAHPLSVYGDLKNRYGVITGGNFKTFSSYAEA